MCVVNGTKRWGIIIHKEIKFEGESPSHLKMKHQLITDIGTDMGYDLIVWFDEDAKKMNNVGEYDAETAIQFKWVGRFRSGWALASKAKDGVFIETKKELILFNKEVVEAADANPRDYESEIILAYLKKEIKMWGYDLPLYIRYS